MFPESKHQKIIARSKQKYNAKHHQNQNSVLNDREDDRKGSFDDEDRELLKNFKSQMLMNDDINKFHKDFAGDTFSQISSTYENQNAMYNQQSNNELLKGKNISKNSQNKLYQYQEKHSRQQQHNNDELLDSDILNNSAELQSPNGNNNHLHHQNNNGKRQIQNSHKYEAPHNINPQFSKYNGLFPSPHSNNLNMIMNSEHLQQSTSTLTVYNSGLFDEASIMRILDKTISDDDLYSLTEELNGGKQHQRYQVEQNFKFECDDVMSILGSLSQQLKDKLQKSRINGRTHSNQQVVISIEDLKQLEIFSTSAMEKVRQLKKVGVESFQQNEYKTIKLKQYKENLKIHIHKQIQKYKELCKKQYSQAEHHRFKYQIMEFDQNQRINLLEEKLDRQQDDINRQANQCEQVKYQKLTIMNQYDQRMNEMEQQLRLIIKNLQDDSKSVEKLQKISNSFCIGDHSMLLQPLIQNVKNKIIKDTAKIPSNKQSVEEKENESILSNQGEQPNKSIKSQLINLKKMVQEIKKVNQQFNQQQQEGGSMYYQDSVHNLLSNLFNIQNGQQSQVVKPEGSQASVNQAFIQSCYSSVQKNQNDEQLIEQQQQEHMSFLREFEKEDHNKNNTTLDMSFNQNEIIFECGGKRQALEESKELHDFMKLDGQITEHDLKNNQQLQLLSESKKLVASNQREKLLNQNHYQSIGSPDELQINEGSIGFMMSNHNISNLQNSVEDDILILNFGQDQQSFKQQSAFLGDLSRIEDNKVNNMMELTGQSHQKDDNILMNESLYSGGSSLINLNCAFYPSKPKVTTDFIVIRINNREIQMPKLDLDVAKKHTTNEYFKNNIKSSQAFSSGSSSSMNSSINLNLQSQVNHGSFINESLSKQMILNTGTQNNIAKLSQLDLKKSMASNALDQNISALDNQQSQQEHTEENEDFTNMFGTFKEELDKQDRCYENMDNNNNHDDTLELDANEEQLSNNAKEGDFYPPLKKPLIDKSVSQEKSLDLSKSIFKKSLSDPNLLFNFIENEIIHNDSPKEMQSQQNESNQNFKQVHQLNIASSSNNRPQFNLCKLQTPQGNQIKIKFNLQNSKQQVPNLKQAKEPEGKVQLNQFASKLRSGNSRQQNQIQNQSSSEQEQEVQQKGGAPAIQIKKIKKIIKLQKHQDMTTYIDEHKLENNNDQSIMAKLSFIQDAKVNQTNINDSVDNQAQPLFIGRQRNSRESVVLNQMKSEEQHQLVQNYLSAANVMSSIHPQKQPSKIKGSIALRKFTPSMIEQEDKPQVDQQQNNNFIQQFKEFQEQYDMDGAVKSGRKNQQQNMISPNKSQERVSQSCTPQKKKNIIVVSKQLIKMTGKPSQEEIKVVQAINLNSKNTGQNLNFRRISFPKRNSSIKQQNMSVLNQSVNTSQFPVGQQMNVSHLPEETDQSIIIHDINYSSNKILGARLGAMSKIQAPSSKISHPELQTPALNINIAKVNNLNANKNLQNLFVAQPHINVANANQLIEKIRSQKQRLSNDQGQQNESAIIVQENKSQVYSTQEKRQLIQRKKRSNEGSQGNKFKIQEQIMVDDI